MVNGLYVAASAMQAQTQNLDAIAGNLANLSTPGYKRDIPAFSAQLQYLLDNPPGSQPADTPMPEFVQPTITIDLADGSLRRSDNPCDLALQGPGFLVVRTPDGEAYTRSGALTLDPDGNLITHSGYPVLGDGGPISVTGDNWQVSAKGEVSVDGAVVGRLRLVEIPAESLRRIGDGLMLSTGEPTPLDWTKTEVRQGYLELSNANAMWEMVSLIAAMRTFEANQRMVQAEDSTLDKAVNQVGRV